MIDVQATVWVWTPTGMQTVPAPSGKVEYIEKSEVQRLLEEAHTLGWDAASRAAAFNFVT